MEEQYSEELQRDIEKLNHDIRRYNENQNSMEWKQRAKEWERLSWQSWKLEEEWDLECSAPECKLDKETYRLLKTFRDECLVPRFEGDFYADFPYIEDLKPFEDEIKAMGSIFEMLGLAKKLQGFAWEPRQRLRHIVAKRLAPTPQKFDGDEDRRHQLNMALVRTYLEIADVADVVLRVMLALGVEREFEKGRRTWRPNRALREFLISASVKGRFASASLRGFLASQLQLVVSP